MRSVQAQRKCSVTSKHRTTQHAAASKVHSSQLSAPVQRRRRPRAQAVEQHSSSWLIPPSVPATGTARHSPPAIVGVGPALGPRPALHACAAGRAALPDPFVMASTAQRGVAPPAAEKTQDRCALPCSPAKQKSGVSVVLAPQQLCPAPPGRSIVTDAASAQCTMCGRSSCAYQAMQSTWPAAVSALAKPRLCAKGDEVDWSVTRYGISCESARASRPGSGYPWD